MISIQIRKKHLFYVLAVSSSLIAAVVTGIDSWITHLLVETYSFEKVPWLFGFSAFLVGTVVTLLLCLLFSIPFKGRSIGGRLIDPSFNHLRLVQREELKYHLLAGLGNAVTTVGYFYLLSVMVDPSAVLPFYQVVILYLLMVEVVAEKNSPTLVEVQSSVIVTFGAILGSISLSGNIDLTAMAVIFLVVNPGWVILSIYQRRLKLLKIKDKPNDSLNIRFWNLVFTFIFITVFILVFDQVRGTSYFMESLDASRRFFWWIALSMSVTFFSYVFYIRALGIGKASITQAVKATTIIFAVPVTFVLTLFMPISMPSTPVLWLIKGMGMILVVLGIVSFAVTQVKAYVFIRAQPGVKVSSLLEEVWNIRGVDSVSAVSGKYDLVAKVRIRTLLKGYERIIRKLETIPGIKEFRWNSILKEWENV
ncbi:MAG: Lrp/AsnC ligand binding domain-containing protein [Thermoplasmata archaeon]|nr:Lrp/AsnC ligand binding domain-containing protein [Thermoplasmata archaeon]RLF26718.1 MAG: hypothetical protein DRN01_04135 [Thermoplasmata archaeon]